MITPNSSDYSHSPSRDFHSEIVIPISIKLTSLTFQLYPLFFDLRVERIKGF